MGDTDITLKTRMKAIADFLQNALHEPLFPRIETVVKKSKEPPPPPLPSSRYFGVGTQKETVAIHSNSAVYDSPEPRFSFEEISDDDDNDDDEILVKEDVRIFGMANVGPIASPHILPYLYNRPGISTLDTVSEQTVTRLT